jgi:hypothetical protein
MSEGGSDWRDGSAYDYFDDLTPEQVAFEFLRRNPDYTKGYRPPQDDAPDSKQSSAGTDTHWGLRFRSRSDATGRSDLCRMAPQAQSEDGIADERCADPFRWPSTGCRKAGYHPYGA